MKRNSASRKWLIPSLFLLVSCGQEVMKEAPETRRLEIVASQDPAESMDKTSTKTTLVDGVNVYWTASDRIMVFSAGSSARFTSENTEPAAEATFTGTIELPEESAADPYVRALYPFNSNATLREGTVTTTLPSTQVGVAGTFDDDLVILASRGVPPSASGSQTVSMDMTFKHVCSGIKFRLVRDDVKRVKLTSRGGEPVAGEFSFAWNNSGVPVVSSVTTPSSSVTVNAPSGGAFTPGVWYYIVTLPVEFTSGVTFTLTNTDNLTAERVIETGFSLSQGAFSSATDLDANIQFVEGGGDEPEPEVEVQVAGPDTWVATDELKRVIPTVNTGEDVPSTRDNRKVLMFYTTWHTDHQVTYSPIVNVTGVKWFYPEALTNPTHGAWGNSSNYTADGSNNGKAAQLCFWGEPLFGYYRTTDPWVLRKHAEMLADAGVDAVIFDCTNGEFLWLSSVEALFKTWSAAKAEGVNVPKVAFMLQLSVQKVNERNALRMLYYGYTDSSQYDNNSSLKGFYSRGEYSDLWFRLDGDTKPFIMAYPESLDLTNPEDKKIFDFFTWRPGQPDYVYGDYPDGYGNHQWGWLQNYPQNKFNYNSVTGETEQMTVGVAQNASDASGGHCFAINSPDTYGRSYTKAHGNQNLVEATEPGEVASFKYGYNFQEQWDRAHEVDPHYVLITQWNEWVALKMNQWPTKGASQGWYGSPNPPGYAFADQFDAERSRDIEPTANWGDNGDNYYYQLVKNVRKFKGVGAYPNVSGKKTMAIDGDFTGWEKVSPDFKHYGGNTMKRDHAGHSSLKYTNTTNRNDFVDARVTRDNDYVYFYIETKANITDYRNDKWMRLLIDIDMNWNTGWKGYDFCVNYLNPTSASQGIVSRATGSDWEWEDAGTFDYAVNGNKMEIRVPRSALGLGADDKLDFGFKWCDNNLYDEIPAGRETRILNLYVDGDAAPGGRFNFHYKEPVE